MDWSTSALMNNSPLARRLPGQRTPPDPTIAQANAADLTYGWHSASNSSSSESDEAVTGDTAGESSTGGLTRQGEAALALRRRRRQLRGEPPLRSADTDDENDGYSSEGSIASYRSASNAHTQQGSERPIKTTTASDADEARPGPAPASSAPDHDPDGFICRICFDGPGSQDEGGESLGKLIAPCRCRGTMKFVHQACLTRWRATSMRQASIMACDQCGSPYKFRKSRFVGLATNRALILLVSCLLFVLLIWTVGFTAESVVHRWDAKSAGAVAANRRHKDGDASAGGVWDYILGEDDDSSAHAYSDYDSGVYSYGYGYATTFYWEPLSYVKLIRSAVKHVASGRASRAVKQLVRGNDAVSKDSSSTEEKELGWYATLLDDWKYGPGGIWEGQRPVLEVDEQHAVTRAESEEDGASSRERYDARTATVLKHGQKAPRDKTSSRGKQPLQEGGLGVSSWWDRMTLQFSLGFSLVGIFSFINLLLGVSFWGPFHLGNFGLGRSFARLTGGGRRRGGGGGGGGGDGGSIASVILLFLVVIGIIRALLAVISLTTYLSKRLLTRVEDYIVEYSGEEEQNAGGAAAQ